MSLLSREDYDLSMKLSRRRKPGAPEEAGLRSLLVHRLSDTAKLVFRRGLRSEDMSALCEPCGKWTVRHIDDSEFGSHWTCEGCGRKFRAEFVVFEEIE